MASPSTARPPSPATILLASLIGTTIEFFDFYIYATAAVLVFPRLFFPSGDPTSATLQSFATFSIAFFARPLGSAIFGHFGDRVGRKATLVAALLTMGLSTVAIGLLPGHASIGVLAPLGLSLCRCGQGIGLGGEWGGAVLLATENAPPGKRALYGMFPQLGAPIGFILSTASFLVLTGVLPEADFLAWGWRIPFVASSLLVLLGLFVRLRVTETPAFAEIAARDERERVPIVAVLRRHGRELVLGTTVGLTAFVLFYLMTVFALSHGTAKLGYGRAEFLKLQMVGVVCFGLTIPFAARVADELGRRLVLVVGNVAIALFGLSFGALFVAGSPALTATFLAIGLGLMGVVYGPLGTVLSELFPTSVRYTGASLAFNLSGIFGASLAPSVATWLASRYGIAAVGWYLAGAALLALAALALAKETGRARS